MFQKEPPFETSPLKSVESLKKGAGTVCIIYSGALLQNTLRIGEMRINRAEKALDNGKQLAPALGVYRMQLL